MIYWHSPSKQFRRKCFLFTIGSLFKMAFYFCSLKFKLLVIFFRRESEKFQLQTQTGKSLPELFSSNLSQARFCTLTAICITILDCGGCAVKDMIFFILTWTCCTGSNLGRAKNNRIPSQSAFVRAWAFLNFWARKWPRCFKNLYSCI